MNFEKLKHDIFLPSNVERMQIFHWLKRTSSLTTWNRIFEYYESWTQVIENSWRIADENGWADETSLPESEYRLALKCLAHCEKGVLRLKQGDKSVFKYDANGEFQISARIISHWIQMLS